jgi:hypothetical protein
VVGLAKNMVETEETDFGTADYPRVKSVVRVGMYVSRNGVNLVPVNYCEDK